MLVRPQTIVEEEVKGSCRSFEVEVDLMREDVYQSGYPVE
jgi:hypothetical protein